MDAILPPSRAISGGGRPPRPAMAPPDVSRLSRRRPFVTPQPRPTAAPPDAGLPHRQEGHPPNVGLPRRQERPPPDAGLPRRQEGPPPGPHALSFTEPHTTTRDAGSTTSSPADVYKATGNDFSPNPIVHWTSGYYEPRASLQSFMALLTEETDADLELLMQPDATPSSGGKGSSKRGSNYTNLEDIQRGGTRT